MKELIKLNPQAFLVVTTTLGFFTLVIMLYFKAFPPESKDILNVMLGVVGAAWSGIVGYFFGSSQGSARKTDLLATPASKEQQP